MISSGRSLSARIYPLTTFAVAGGKKEEEPLAETVSAFNSSSRIY